MNSVFMLLAEFNTTQNPLEQVAPKYFGLDMAKAKRKAAGNELPIPFYRAASSQKCPWVCNAEDLANLLDMQREAANSEFNKSR